MDTNPALPTFTVAPSSVINGATNAYEISIISSIELIDDDYLTFTIPSTVKLASTAITCSAVSNVLSVTCSKIGTTGVKVNMKFTGGE